MSNQTIVTVEPEQTFVRVRDGRISAEALVEHTKLHVERGPGDDATSGRTRLLLTGDGTKVEIEVQTVDIRGLIEGLREVGQ